MAAARLQHSDGRTAVLVDHPDGTGQFTLRVDGAPEPVRVPTDGWEFLPMDGHGRAVQARLTWSVRWSADHLTWVVDEYDYDRPSRGHVTIAVYPVQAWHYAAAPVQWAAAVTGVRHADWLTLTDVYGYYYTTRGHRLHRDGSALQAHTHAAVQGTHWVGMPDELTARTVADQWTAYDARRYAGDNPAQVMPIAAAVGMVAAVAAVR